jgi:hypothetical protein
MRDIISPHGTLKIENYKRETIYLSETSREGKACIPNELI